MEMVLEVRKEPGNKGYAGHCSHLANVRPAAPRLPAGGGGGSHGAGAAAADEEGGAAQGDAAVQGGAPTDDAPAYLKVAGVARLKLIEEQKLLKRLAAGLLNTI